MIRMWRSICHVRRNDSAFRDDLILRQRKGVKAIPMRRLKVCFWNKQALPFGRAGDRIWPVPT